MTPNPILKVLSTLKKHNVKSLLIGGQACIIYGACEFSRDSDFFILSTTDNLESLKKALKTLKAKLIYVPPLERDYLERGHACHFRCNAKDVKGLRVDVIAKMRGCGPFDELWERRAKVSLKKGIAIDILSLQDLVWSKKTQRDKDWLMLKRLVDNDIIQNEYKQQESRIKWWIRECRDAAILIELAKRYPEAAKENTAYRPLLSTACSSDPEVLDSQLRDEEMKERKNDKEYWAPLRKELELLRHKRS